MFIPRYNPAQLILTQLGLPDAVFLSNYRRKSPSFTKKGPGRKHHQGSLPAEATEWSSLQISQAITALFEAQTEGAPLGQPIN